MPIDITEVQEPRKGAFIINTVPKIRGSNKIASFDLDHTSIKPKSGKKFPQNQDDWMILQGVQEKLQQLFKDNYKIVIFTNQGGKAFQEDPDQAKKDFSEKIKAIAAEIQVPLQVYGCHKEGFCRKPSGGMWWLLTRNNEGIEIDPSQSFYVGDAASTVAIAGRPKDFSDSDLKFAMNVGIRFYDDRYFQEGFEEVTHAKPYHPLEFENVYVDQKNEFKASDTQEMILLVGSPACGKSSWAKEFVKNAKNYVIACQDDLGTKPKVMTSIKKTLAAGKSVVVDKQNYSQEGRAELIELAENISVRIVWFDIPRDLAEHLSTYREIMTGKHIPSMVFNKFYSVKGKGLEVPTDDEAPVTKIFFKKNMDIVTNPTLFLSYLI